MTNMLKCTGSLANIIYIIRKNNYLIAPAMGWGVGLASCFMMFCITILMNTKMST